MIVTQDEMLRELADKQAIAEVLYTYCRGVDRCDRTILASAYWPDAYEEHADLFQGNLPDFLDYIEQTVAGMRTVHNLSNILIRFESPTLARSECHGLAHHSIVLNGALTNVVGGVRYLDVLEEHGLEWRILRRRLVVDYLQMSKNCEMGDVFGPLRISGAHAPDDPLYEHLGSTHRNTA
jgi:hypothetical protein